MKPIRPNETQRDYLKRARKYAAAEFTRGFSLHGCYSDTHDLEQFVERILARTELVFVDLKTHGVESIDINGEHWLYLNTGDSYGVTILWSDFTGKFRIGSWGDLVENAES